MDRGTIILLALTFFIAFAATALLVPPVMRLCRRRGWLARPGGRRLHAQPTPNVGGIAIYGGFVLVVLGSFVFDRFLLRSEFEQLRLGLLLAGGTLIFLVMWLDDVRELPPLPKFVAQALAALIAVGPFAWDHRLYPPGDQARGIILTAFKFPFVEQVNLYNISQIGRAHV